MEGFMSKFKMVDSGKRNGNTFLHVNIKNGAAARHFDSVTLNCEDLKLVSFCRE